MGRRGGEGHHFSPARQYVPNEIHLFKTLYIITLSGPAGGTPRPPLRLFRISAGPRMASQGWGSRATGVLPPSP